jgi:hypothetical protein
MSSNDQVPENSQADWWSSPEALAELVQKAMDRAVRQAIEEHHRAGQPVSIWRDGQIVLLYPDGSVQPASSNEPTGGV